METFLEFTSVVILATILSIIMRLLKQPLVIGYILAGIFIGPHVFDLMHTKDYIELFSKIGITILLFIVGLNLSPRVVKEVGKVSLLGGFAQIVLTTVFGFVISRLLGISIIQSMYIAIALSFSSTIIILKLLSDKGDLEKLYGKVAIGFLLIQDLVAIALLMVISSLSGSAGAIPISQILLVIFVKVVLILFILFGISKYILPKAIHFFASSQELLFLFSISWGLGLACIFYVFRFSIEVGALIAGVTLSLTSFADGIASRLKPLRDFFIVLFFILLGSEMVLDTIAQLLVPALIISVFVLFGKPLIVFLLMNLLGYKTRPAFQTAVSLGQVSEFSLILVTLGFTIGHVDKDVVSLVTISTLVSIAGSSYMMIYSDRLYERLKRFLQKIEIKKNRKEIAYNEGAHDLVLFGYDRVGSDFVHAFAKLDKKYVVIDLNPDLIKKMEVENIPFKYGDAEDIEFLQELNLHTIKLCVSTIPYIKVNALLLKRIRSVNNNAIVIVRARETEDAKLLYSLGASYVVMPHYLGAQYATQMIAKHGLDPKGFEAEREKHLAHVHKKST